MTMEIIYGAHSVQIVNSYKVSRESSMRQFIAEIQANPKCPPEVQRREPASLLREWQAHNELYELGVQRERTGSVDFDDEPRWRRTAYGVLAALYKVFHAK